MTYKLALQLRNTLHALFTLSEPQVYFVAIRKAYLYLNDDTWEVCLYGRHEVSTFLLPLGTLALAIDKITPELHASMDTYDAGSTEESRRVCITIK